MSNSILLETIMVSKVNYPPKVICAKEKNKNKNCQGVGCLPKNNL